MLYQRQPQPQPLKRKTKQGDWICIQCFNYNYSFRQYCNRCRCQQRKENERLMNAIGKQNYGESSFPSVLFLQYPNKKINQNPPEPFRNPTQKVFYVQKTTLFNSLYEQNETLDELDAIPNQNIWISNLIGQ